MNDYNMEILNGAMKKSLSLKEKIKEAETYLNVLKETKNILDKAISDKNMKTIHDILKITDGLV